MAQRETFTNKVAKTSRAQAKVERRLALIEATVETIAVYGLSGTTIARVTEIAGTSVGLANFHFENKERLFEAVLRHLAENEKAALQEHLEKAPDDPAHRLLALIEARFDPRILNPKTAAVWFAFWGDASARSIYRRVVATTDDARLATFVPVLESLLAEHDGPVRDAYDMALGMEAFYDGLWLNYLLYPDDYRRVECRKRAIDHLISLFPQHIDALSVADSVACEAA
ncbi:MAG: TetR family transcriptional regulator [Nitrospiraceae bacterium]|nr:TetR family transcriptional regulator [Nitrospiraceae bacterium]